MINIFKALLITMIIFAAIMMIVMIVKWILDACEEQRANNKFRSASRKDQGCNASGGDCGYYGGGSACGDGGGGGGCGD
jgi:hypothetical protein